MAELPDAPWASAPASLPDAPWATDAPAKTAPNGAAADFGKSGGIGLAKGLIDFAGTPGDAANLLTKGSKAAGDYIGGLFGQEPSPEPTGPILPTSGQIQKGIEDQTGQFYRPQTTAGKYAGTIGEFMGNPLTYAGPGSMVSKALMGAAGGAGSEAAGQLVEAGGDKFAPLEPYARFAGGLGAGALAGRLGRPSYTSAPTVEELKDSATGHYNAMHGFGVELHPDVMDNVATNIDTELRTQGYRPINAPKTFGVLDELRNPDGKYMTTQQIESTRRALNKARADPAERDAARRAINQIDDALESLQPGDVAINPHYADRVAQEAKAARGDYAAMKQAEEIEKATTRAERQAASTGSGGNINNATRQQFKNLLNNEKKMRGIPDDVRAQMEQVVRGGYGGDVSRLIGKMAINGIVSATGAAALSHLLGIPHGVLPTIGYAFKKIGDVGTPMGARKSSALRRLDSPLARQLGSTPPPPGYGRAKSLIGPGLSSAFQYPNPYK